ncbi:MAG TPA: hypothetical protein VLE70_21800 [Anaerolineae bacterium]|jgi:hypothetical protein|nr:hypothetical protein [Anaerolineae bacterium]
MVETCQFRLKGHLDKSWAEWLNDMSIVQRPDGTTLITGQIADQAALFGLLSRLRDLGLPLLSVNILEPDNRAMHQKTIERH